METTNRRIDQSPRAASSHVKVKRKQSLGALT